MFTNENYSLAKIQFDSDFLDPLYISEPTRSQVASEIKLLVEKEGIIIHKYFTGEMTRCVNLISHPNERIREDGMCWCKETIHLATELGAKGMGGRFDTVSYQDRQDPERYKFLVDNLISSLQHLAKLAKKEKQEFILWEQMYAPSEAPYTLDQTKELLEKVNHGAELPIYLTIDVGHACCQNYPHKPEDRNPYNWLRRFAHLSPVIHLQQTNDRESCHWPFTKKFNRRGIIQAQKVIEALQTSGVKETLLVLEIFFSLAKNDKQVLDEMRESVNYWRKYVEE